jgi:hypothetical protein
MISGKKFSFPFPVWLLRFCSDSVASGVVQVLLLLPAAGVTKVRETEYGRPWWFWRVSVYKLLSCCLRYNSQPSRVPLLLTRIKFECCKHLIECRQYLKIHVHVALFNLICKVCLRDFGDQLARKTMPNEVWTFSMQVHFCSWQIYYIWVWSFMHTLCSHSSTI